MTERSFRLLALQGCDQDIQRITESLAVLREMLKTLPREDSGKGQADYARLSAVLICAQITAAEQMLRTKRRRRTVLARALDPTFLSEYERIFLHRGGVAVVQVINEICQGCHIANKASRPVGARREK
jgi:predicted  nucleic acid-binding Zn-ribbon protein